MPRSPSLVPLFLDLGGRDVLVVGAGPIAERKTRELVDGGAKVRVVAPHATDGVRALADGGALAWEARPFADADADGAWLIVAATNDPAAQAQVARAAEARRTFLLAIDDRTHATAYSGAIIRREGMTVALSTSGVAPALARLLREVIEQALPDAAWIEAARALREKWKTDKTPMESRFGELVRAFKEKLPPPPEAGGGPEGERGEGRQ